MKSWLSKIKEVLSQGATKRQKEVMTKYRWWLQEGFICPPYGPSHVFVFGSNLAGRHLGGAAHYARRWHKAKDGVGRGHEGYSYAIPTVDRDISQNLPICTIGAFVSEFLTYAGSRPDLTFYVTPIGTGIAGIPVEKIAPMFFGATYNVILPKEFLPTFIKHGA